MSGCIIGSYGCISGRHSRGQHLSIYLGWKPNHRSAWWDWNCIAEICVWRWNRRANYLEERHLKILLYHGWVRISIRTDQLKRHEDREIHLRRLRPPHHHESYGNGPNRLQLQQQLFIHRPRVRHRNWALLLSSPLLWSCLRPIPWNWPHWICRWINLYGYVGNNPWNWVDPWGLDARDLDEMLKLVENQKQGDPSHTLGQLEVGEEKAEEAAETTKDLMWEFILELIDQIVNACLWVRDINWDGITIHV